MRHKTLVEGDANLLNKDEILVTQSEGYTILREKTASGIKTFVVIPLEELTKKSDDKPANDTKTEKGSE